MKVAECECVFRRANVRACVCVSVCVYVHVCVSVRKSVRLSGESELMPI